MDDITKKLVKAVNKITDKKHKLPSQEEIQKLHVAATDRYKNTKDTSNLPKWFVIQREITEANNPATMQAVPPKAKTLGNVNPVTGETESGVHEYDPETGEKSKTYSMPNSDYQETPEERKQRQADEAEDARVADVYDRGTDTKTTVTRYSTEWKNQQEKDLAKRFPEAYPEKNVGKLYDAEGNDTGRVLQDVSKTDTSTVFSPEAQTERVKDFITNYNPNKSYDENKKIWNMGGSQSQGDPFDVEVKQTRGMGIDLRENHMLSFKQYLQEKTAAWTRKEGKDPEGGLNKKGVESYRRENPGSKLQTAVTTKPSKLKPGSKKAKRRKSFCKRMKGMKAKLTSAKTARDPDSRINKALRKWNCE